MWFSLIPRYHGDWKWTTQPLRIGKEPAASPATRPAGAGSGVRALARRARAKLSCAAWRKAWPDKTRAPRLLDWFKGKMKDSPQKGKRWKGCRSLAMLHRSLDTKVNSPLSTCPGLIPNMGLSLSRRLQFSSERGELIHEALQIRNGATSLSPCFLCPTL